MNVRELITELAAIGAHADIREFTVQAYDPEDERWRDITGIIVSPQKKSILIFTDEL